MNGLNIRPAKPGRLILAVISFFFVCAGLAAPAAQAGNALPDFSMDFEPATIGSDSIAELVFTIQGQSGAPVAGLAFTHVLAAGLRVAGPAGAFSTCTGGTLSATPGGSTIDFSGGAVASATRCQIRVLVTGSTVGVFSNVSGDLTSNAGNSGNASADLTIAGDRPGFSKSFSAPTSVIGQRARLNFTFDNSRNANAAANILFSDSLPTGLVVADPANVTNTCDASITSPFPLDYTGGRVIAEPGTSFVGIAFSIAPDQAALAPGDTCEIGVDVVSTAVGTLDNISDPMTSQLPPFGVATTSGLAAASLDSQAGSIVLIKEFLDDPVPPGETIDLRFTILNRTGGAASISPMTWTPR
jgi:uncharacterized repeat protein (TIGR01451 family)